MDVSPSVQPFERIYELVIRKGVFEEILSHVKEEYPIEACGILLGHVREGKGFAERAKRLRNILASNTSFWFDVREWMSAILDARREGLSYIGLYHSHGREKPLPSLSDQHRMLECPGEVWLIVAYTPDSEPKVAAYRIDDFGSAIARVPVRII
ncbi:MAG: M67 family metallopeptidase [Thermofilaceae archaeon]